MTKRCSKCNEVKSEDEFYYNPKTSNRLESWCKECNRSRNRGSRHKELLREKYGMTEVDYEIMLKKQNGVCAICGQSEIVKDRNNKIKRLSVDHDHPTGIVRELLCDNCNHMLGNAKESSEILREAASYLEKHFKRIQNLKIIKGGY